MIWENKTLDLCFERWVRQRQRVVLMKWDFSLTKNEVGFFTRDKSNFGKVYLRPEVGEYTRVGRDMSTTV